MWFFQHIRTHFHQLVQNFQRVFGNLVVKVFLCDGETLQKVHMNLHRFQWALDRSIGRRTFTRFESNERFKSFTIPLFSDNITTASQANPDVIWVLFNSCHNKTEYCFSTFKRFHWFNENLYTLEVIYHYIIDIRL